MAPTATRASTETGVPNAIGATDAGEGAVVLVAVGATMVARGAGRFR